VQFPVGLAVQLLLALAVGIWLSVLGVFVRDTISFINFVFNLLMYVSPIVYREELVPERYRWLLAWNPFTTLMRVYRNTLIDGRPIDNWGALLAWSLVFAAVLAAGVAMLRAVHRKLYRFL
jgi:ABC-type polysaccharide/polyol phosphate export permease